MSVFNLSFDQLREANLKRIPLFKNGRGELAHPPVAVHQANCEYYTTPIGITIDCGDDCKQLVPGADWSLGEWACAVTGELGELANLIKKARRGDTTLEAARPEIQRELADVACYLDILALQCGVNLGDAIVIKFNEVSDRIDVAVKLGGPEAAETEASLIETLNRMAAAGMTRERLLTVMQASKICDDDKPADLL